MFSETISPRKAFFIGLLFLCFMVASTTSAQQYQVTAIEPLAGHTASCAMGINNSGKVVGRFYNLNSSGEVIDRQAFIWDEISGPRSLSSLSGESSAWDINDNGMVSGYFYDSTGKQHAALWDSVKNSVVDIGTLKNSTTGSYGDSSTAYGLNNTYQAVGNADIPNNDGSFMPFHAFLYDLDRIFDLGTLTTQWPEWQNGYSIAYGINTNGVIVGTAQDSSWAYLPFISDGTAGMQALQRDSNYPNGEWYAVVINDSGLIGGHVIAPPNQSLPYYWPSKSSAPIKITMPSGFPYGEIYGINAWGQMVGIMWSTDLAGATEHAFIFDAQNGVRDLNNLIDPASGWLLHFARDINDGGQIVGYGELNGEKRGFILNPVSVSAQLLSLDGVTGAQPGSTVTLRAQIRNTGTVALPSNAKVLFYVSGPWSGYVGSVSASGLAAGSSQWYSVSWFIPADAPMGTYSYSTEIWTDKVISGSSIWQSFSVSANPNVSAVSAELLSLDLVVGAQPGSSVTLRAQIRNTGTMALPSNAKVWFYVGGPMNSYIGSVSASGLAAGSSQWYSVTWSIPAGAPVATYYSYSTQVWTDKIISGFTIWQVFSVGAASAQLVSLGQVIRAHPGSRVTLRAQIKNTGSSALPSNAKVWFFVGGPLNSYVGSVSASGLAAGSSQWYSFPWSIPAHAPVATYYSYSTQVWTDKIISGFAIWQNFVVSLQ